MMTFREFSRTTDVSVEELCRDFFRGHRTAIKIKKEKVAVKNLATIFSAVLKLSVKKGFDAMSLRDLSRESGLSMGALYSYFASKEDLMGMIQRHGAAAVENILHEHIDREGDPKNKLRAAIRTHLFLSEVMKNWFYFFFMETKNLNKKHRKISVENELMTERIITGILKEGIRKKVFTIGNVTLTGCLIKAMMQDWYLKQWKYAKRTIALETYTQFVIDMVESFIINKSDKLSRKNRQS